MKKLFLIFAMTALVSSAWAQSQLTTVRGKTKDGKTIKVEYYQGNVEDYIESVKYQLVDELEARVAELQTKLDAANKQIKDLKARNQGGDQEKQISELYGQIDVLNEQIRKLNRQLTERNISYDSLATVNQGLQQQLANSNNTTTTTTTVVVNTDEKELQRLRDSIVSKDATISNLNRTLTECERRMTQLEAELARAESRPAGMPRPTPVIGVTLGLGPVFPKGALEEGWNTDLRWAKKVEVYFGTQRLSAGVPISVEVGAGIRSLKLSATMAGTTTTENATDADGDSYQAIYTYSDRTENVALTYVDIPVRLCFGQPYKNRVGVYAKLGLTPSIKISDTFEGVGTYSLKGYYPQWDVTLEDIAELGFGSGMDCYADATAPEASSFVLWGNAKFGAYVPFGASPVLLSAGLGIDLPFMALGQYNAATKAIVPSFEIGLVYTLK